MHQSTPKLNYFEEFADFFELNSKLINNLSKYIKILLSFLTFWYVMHVAYIFYLNNIGILLIQNEMKKIEEEENKFLEMWKKESEKKEQEEV
jgi:hypothetical protein